MKKKVAFVFILIAAAGCRIYSPHFLVFEENYRAKKFAAYEIEVKDTSKLDIYYDEIRLKFDTLLINSKANLDFYVEFKKYSNQRRKLVIQ